MKIRSSLLLATITIGTTGLAVLALTTVPVRAASSADEDLSRGIHSMAEALSVLEKNFADPISTERAIYDGAIPGMLRTLDPHSNFLDPNEFRDMQRRQKAQYFGVGMEISVDGENVIVNQPFVGSPAWKAGLRRGDVIAAVNGRSARGMDTGQVADILRGPKGTPVSITIHHQGGGDADTVQVIRGEIQTKLVDAFWLKPGVAYLGITSFEAENVADDVEAALSQLGEQSINGLVLDLRGNPGGLLNEAVAIAGRYLRDGQTVVSHRGRAEEEQVFRAKAKPEGQRYPIVVLVDRRSASASEIVSGALQDHDRAWVIGENTFGKGLVQGQFPLSEGAALLLTIAHYYTPSGRLIQRDYQHRSFFDYYYAGRNDGPNLQDVKATDSGRKVYGGGGIMPDEKYEATRANVFQRRVLSAFAFYHFASRYFNGHAPKLPDGWTPDTATLDRFSAFLKEEHVPFTDDEFAANHSWLVDQLRWEFNGRVEGKTMADRLILADDPEVIHGMDSLPKAEALFQQVQHALAQRAAR